MAVPDLARLEAESTRSQLGLLNLHKLERPGGFGLLGDQHEC